MERDNDRIDRFTRMVIKILSIFNHSKMKLFAFYDISGSNGDMLL